MSKNVRTQLGKVVGKSLNGYHARVKPKIDELKFKEQYQGRIIDCMVGEVDDNYIETPETDSAIVKLEHSKEGLVKVPSIKGKTMLVDSDGNETDTPAEGCRLVSVGEEEDNKLIILSNNINLCNKEDYPDLLFGGTYAGLTFNVLEDGKVSVKGTNTEIVTCFCKKEYINLLENGVRYTVRGRGVGVEVTYFDGTKTWGAFTFDKSTIKSVKVYFQWMQIQTYNEICEPYFGREDDLKNQYIEHKSHKTEILLDEPLRKLPNGVCDEVMGNKLIRRIGKVVLNGNENWNNASSFNEYNRFRILHNLQIAFKPYEVNYMTDRIKCIPNKQYQEKSEHIEFDQFHISIMSTIESVELLKQLLKDNPLELFYELKEPIIEELPNGIALQGFDDTTIYIVVSS